MALPAFAAERRAAAALVVQQSIDISHSGKPAAGCCSWRTGQTDGQTPYRFIDPALHTKRAVSIRKRNKTINRRKVGERFSLVIAQTVSVDVVIIGAKLQTKQKKIREKSKNPN